MTMRVQTEESSMTTKTPRRMVGEAAVADETAPMQADDVDVTEDESREFVEDVLALHQRLTPRSDCWWG
jgi:hypothetical protein